MAKEEKENEQQHEEPKKPQSKKGILQWAILGAVLIVLAGAGFFVGRMLKGSSVPRTGRADAAQDDTQAQTEDSLPDDGKTWFYKKFEPVVANLNDPGVMRYVRATLTFEISSAAPPDKTIILFEEKTPTLTNWLTIYLASLGLEDIRGDKNLKRIQAQILDAFNEELFPNQKPKIVHILFKEFAIQ
ncbi:MAG TPA: flagellar basal body-associated FliL family protein [Sedimentisphaerales bacterium]|nr:flagellar basal body-associated FliL family protein [Sedimentisphaerales bacterium]